MADYSGHYFFCCFDHIVVWINFLKGDGGGNVACVIKKRRPVYGSCW